QDLTICIRVSRAWNATFSPALWRHLDICWDEDKTRQKEITGALNAHKELVHSLKLRAKYEYLFYFIHPRPPTLPNLTSMEIESSFEVIGDKHLVKLIGMSIRGPKSFEVLLNSVNTLVVVRFEGQSEITGHHIDTLLCSAPNLKEMYCYSCSCDSSYVPWLDAKGIVDSDWICSGLEVFACQIRGIPRPDITRDICGQSARNHIMNGALQESLTLHHQIYTKLGQFVKLRELTLGLPLDTDTSYCGQRDQAHHRQINQAYYRQFDCLAMTLDSGLDLLRGLGNLKTVGLLDMEVYVDGDKEQEWFREHWPNATIRSTHQAVDLGICT
ncbi:hypothetical protein BGW39_001799, partial [Mortierella sp. 14UC]